MDIVCCCCGGIVILIFSTMMTIPSSSIVAIVVVSGSVGSIPRRTVDASQNRIGPFRHGTYQQWRWHHCQHYRSFLYCSVGYWFDRRRQWRFFRRCQMSNDDIRSISVVLLSTVVATAAIIASAMIAIFVGITPTVVATMNTSTVNTATVNTLAGHYDYYHFRFGYYHDCCTIDPQNQPAICDRNRSPHHR